MFFFFSSNRIHDLKTLRQICLIEAHDSEILYLDYTKYNDNIKLLASASRDRLIHVFNVNQVSFLLNNISILVMFTYHKNVFEHQISVGNL